MQLIGEPVALDNGVFYPPENTSCNTSASLAAHRASSWNHHPIRRNYLLTAQPAGFATYFSTAAHRSACAPTSGARRRVARNAVSHSSAGEPPSAHFNKTRP